MNTDWKEDLIEKYREKFGCENLGEVCWCEICTNIGNLISDTIKHIKENIPD